MKHVALVLLLGALAGLAAHLIWFQARRPTEVDTAAGALTWLREDLRLSEEQFARVKAIHEQSSPQFQQLAAEAARMRTELEVFERQRQTDGEIDFIAFAQFVQMRREFDRACAESTRQLIAATAREMTEGQRERYLEWLNPARRLTGERFN